MNQIKLAAASLIKPGIEDLSVQEIAAMLEIPKDSSMGDIALPCFKLSKIMRKSPVVIADSLCKAVQSSSEFAESFEKCESKAGYLNFFTGDNAMAKTLNEIVNAGENYGKSDAGNGKNIVIDYSAPNIAKPFHIGHLRSTVIGQAIKNIYKFSGYNCIGVNHLGDWGTQFGKLIVAYEKWGDKKDIESRGIKALIEIYVRFHKEAEQDQSLDDLARAAFTRMEQGDEHALSLWKWFVDISIKEFKKTYELIGADFESWLGESFYFDKTDAVVNELKEKQLLCQDDGAYIVPLEDYNMPPCLILKSDGSTIYATRDIAAAFYRKNTYDFEKCIYVTSAGQSLHFAQFFKVIELMGHSWAKDMVHVPFGTVSIGGEKLATRTGNVILLEDIFRDAIEKTLSIINEKNPSLQNKQEVAEAVGVGAVVFHDLSNNRIKDIDFNWEEVLSFEGNTGPYVQYTHARCISILEKAQTNENATVSFTHEKEKELLQTLMLFPEKVNQARCELEPSVISRYLLDVCQSFNGFYHSCPVLKEQGDVLHTRLLLVKATATVLCSGLKLIGLKAPKNI